MSARTLSARLSLFLGLWLLTGTFFLSAEAPPPPPLTYETAEVVDANFFVMTVQFAYEGEDIKFAVFTRTYGEPGLKCSVVYSVRNDRATPLSATLTLGDTTRRDLLQTGGLYRIENGAIQKCDRKFKTSELKDFLKENPKNLTLDEFLAYLRRKIV